MKEKVVPNIKSVQLAAHIIKNYCDSRNENFKGSCAECPIKDICYNEIRLWNV